MSPVFFSQSLPRFLQAIADQFGDEAVARGVVIRDATGRLSFISDQSSELQDDRASAQQVLSEAVGAYARADTVVSYADDPGASRLLNDDSFLWVQAGGHSCRLIDRRIVGSGWIARPQDEVPGPPRIVFASLKGGVGRSTALAVTATDLVRRNSNVLVVDLDLEAPGIGNLLLDDDRRPRFGVLDYLVEDGIGGVPEEILDEFVGISAMNAGAGGRLDVVPVLGQDKVNNPGDVLPMLGRAMIEDISESGDTIPVSNQIASMINRLAERKPYDVVLIDSRAGLSELTAPAVLGLGATVLLFGTAQSQTVEGYKMLFAGLKLLAERDRFDGLMAEWRLLLKLVIAKCSLNEQILDTYRDEMYEVVSQNLYDNQETTDITDSDIIFDVGDRSAPHWPLIIPFSRDFVDFDPVKEPNQLSHIFYEQIFRDFINGIEGIISTSANTR